MTDARTNGWAAVVYGRTRNADSWWRAVPAGVTTDGWLDAAVGAVVDGGNGLAAGPRFLLSRSAGRLLVGVACRAADLHAEMNQHKGRALHCFVGWLSRSGGPDRDGPRLADLEAHYREWAGARYAEWVGRDWDEHRAKLHKPHPSGPVEVPWSVGDRPVPADSLFQDRPDDAVLLVPATSRFGLWEAALCDHGDATVVTGWGLDGRTRLRGATHVCVQGLTVPRPERPRPEPTPAATASAESQPTPSGPREPEQPDVGQRAARSLGDDAPFGGNAGQPSRYSSAAERAEKGFSTGGLRDFGAAGHGTCDCRFDRASHLVADALHALWHRVVARASSVRQSLGTGQRPPRPAASNAFRPRQATARSPYDSGYTASGGASSYSDPD